MHGFTDATAGQGQAVGACQGDKMDVSRCDGCNPSLALCLTM